eukprot:CAMPEP_0113832760 /NCGR_PEP_ID=MMETSP0328-20130328/7549_1 /TAXON_ID=39455 /ORGANISM="Alexandrium minutum" /LENGTH=87 /DNA_ID=CAMNT_0000800991 /DNA_START=24 /DNA_END=284 /DNA_ORIENTATION=- /assembly_acc=CAM_ASM_000350
MASLNPPSVPPAFRLVHADGLHAQEPVEDDVRRQSEAEVLGGVDVVHPVVSRKVQRVRHGQDEAGATLVVGVRKQGVRQEEPLDDVG